jgi:hypothetical protein
MSESGSKQQIIDPYEFLTGQRARLRRLCRDMEAMADELGAYRHISAGSHLIMARMREEMTACHRNEELLFKLIAAQPAECSTRKKCIEVALNEHAHAETCILELDEPFSEAGAGRTGWNRDALGYLLRHVFELVSHHMDWEDALFFSYRPASLSRVAATLPDRGFSPQLMQLDDVNCPFATRVNGGCSPLLWRIGWFGVLCANHFASGPWSALRGVMV